MFNRVGTIIFTIHLGVSKNMPKYAKKYAKLPGTQKLNFFVEPFYVLPKS